MSDAKSLLNRELPGRESHRRIYFLPACPLSWLIHYTVQRRLKHAWRELFLNFSYFFLPFMQKLWAVFFFFFFWSAGLNSHGSWQTENGLHNLMLWKEAISREICFAALPPAAHIFKSPFGRATLLSYLSPLSKKEKKKKKKNFTVTAAKFVS